MRSSKYLLVCVLALALFSGCMGGGGVKNISVSITPTQATVNQGGTRQFNATVTGTLIGKSPGVSVQKTAAQLLPTASTKHPPHPAHTM